jgi:CO/xanthine dehydrogenase Mo-binding subunit
MTLPYLAAEQLGMKPDDFELVYQDTSAAPYDTGATGSQTLLNNGRAVQEAAIMIAGQLKDLAAQQLEAAAGDIILAEAQAHVAGSPERNISIVELAGIASGGELIIGHGSGAPPDYPDNAVGATCLGDQGAAAWVGPQFFCHAARVRVDPDTGVVRVLKVSAAHDNGTILNMTGATGQIEGGILMGIGQALTEGTQYSDEGKQLNAALLEYKLQTSADAPEISIDFVQINTPGAGPNGAKGLAEAPNVPTAAAVACGIAKVLGQPVRQLPMTAERVWETA